MWLGFAAIRPVKYVTFVSMSRLLIGVLSGITDGQSLLPYFSLSINNYPFRLLSENFPCFSHRFVRLKQPIATFL